MTQSVLVVEDDAQLGGQIVAHLRDAGFATTWLRHGRVLTGDDLAQIDLVVLDLMLPGVSGMDMIARIRELAAVPVLVLSARNETADKVRALQLGADDYMTKPFWPEELVERVRARLRRPTLADGSAIEIGGLRIDRRTREVTLEGRPLELTRVEFEFLLTLAERPGAAITRRVLVERALDPDRDGDARTLDVHASRLRKKLGNDGLIETVWGIGYSPLGEADDVKLRTKLVLLCVIAIAATLGALAIYDAIARHRAASELMIDIVQQHLDGARERCEADPARWGDRLPSSRGPGGPPPGHDAKRPPPPDRGPPPDSNRRRPRPLEMWAYDASFRSASADAPTLPGALTEAIADTDVVASDVAWRGDEVAALVRTPWGAGPCAYVFARGSTGDWGAVLPPGRLWLLPSVIVLGAALLVAGPLVRRIRRLTREVEQSASAGYTLGVDERGADEVGELSRAFATASRRIRAELDDRERRERALREFLANTTHDLMIPLTVLQGHLAALRDCAAGPDAVRSAMNEAHYMASLVHNLGAAAKLDVADAVVHRAPVDLREVVGRVAARHRPIAREAGITLDEAVPDAPVLADADVTLVEQAISNLTYNAVRYNHRGGHVAVIVEVAPPGRFCVRVIDDGPGIAEADLARVLARGGRSDAARSRAPEGLGLGLHIALGVAALHGFTLELGAAEGGGLEACLRGPCRPTA